MKRNWEEVDHDPVSGRRIFKSRDSENCRYYGDYSFMEAADFEVRCPDGRVLREMSGSAKGEHWCGVFLWFVKGSDGRQVRLDESDREEDEFYDVPDIPLQKTSAAP